METNTAMKKIFQTNGDWAGLISRLSLGLVILPHGMQKLAGWFGGYGFTGTMDYFSSLGIPVFIGWLIIIAESVGMVAIITGFFSRVMAACMIIIFLGAVVLVHWQHGFFMNWFAIQKGEGIEFFLLAIGLAASIVLNGSGKFSVDQFLTGGK
jgi:putative oxidoreductase